MKRLLLLFLGFLLCAGPVCAKTMYVTDELEITLRSGQGTDYRILSLLKSGFRLQVVEEIDGWTHVRLADGKEGWVLSRMLKDGPPSALLLEKANKRLAENDQAQKNQKSISETLRAENTRLSQELSALQKDAADLKLAYDRLKQESSDFLSTKRSLDSVKRKLASETEDRIAAEQALANMETTKAQRWFLIGAGVLCFGLFLGIIMGRGRTKRRSSLLR